MVVAEHRLELLLLLLECRRVGLLAASVGCNVVQPQLAQTAGRPGGQHARTSDAAALGSKFICESISATSVLWWANAWHSSSILTSDATFCCCRQR